jgi:hypothetical protein
VTGSQHVARGQGCDDAFAYGVVGDFVVAAVADGAGSVSGTSAWGAYTVCQSVLADAMNSEFIRGFTAGSNEHVETLMRWLFDGALDRVTQQADDMGLPVAQLSTTLCVAVSVPARTAFGQIGDGIIATDHGGAIETVLVEDKGEYPNATWFVQSAEAFETSFRTCVRAGTEAFALSTDGMSYKITNVGTGEAYAPFFKGSWDHVRSGANPASLAALLRGIEDDQTGDDKTMVLVTRRWEPDEFYPSARPVVKTIVHSSPPGAPPEVTKVDAASKAAPVIKRSPTAAAPVASTVAPVGDDSGADTDDLRVPSNDQRQRRGWRNRR